MAKRAAYVIFYPDAFKAYSSKLQALERQAEISVSNYKHHLARFKRDDLKAQLRNTEEIVNALIIWINLRVTHL